MSSTACNAVVVTERGAQVCVCAKLQPTPARLAPACIALVPAATTSHELRVNLANSPFQHCCICVVCVRALEAVSTDGTTTLVAANAHRHIPPPQLYQITYQTARVTATLYALPNWIALEHIDEN